MPPGIGGNAPDASVAKRKQNDPRVPAAELADEPVRRAWPAGKAAPPCARSRTPTCGWDK